MTSSGRVIIKARYTTYKLFLPKKGCDLAKELAQQHFAGTFYRLDIKNEQGFLHAEALLSIPMSENLCLARDFLNKLADKLGVELVDSDQHKVDPSKVYSTIVNTHR